MRFSITLLSSVNIEKIFIVHYTKLSDRKQSILSYIDRFKNPYEFINEYDQETLTPGLLSSLYKPEKKLFEDKISPLWDVNTHGFRILNLAEISCTIKHFIAVKKLGESCTGYGLILEDDCMPISSDFISHVQSVIEQTPSDWDSIFLGEGCGVNFINNNIQTNDLKVVNGVCKAKHPASNCAEAYLLKADAARKIYQTSMPFQLVSDWELASSFYRLNLNIFWAVPAVFDQGSKNGTFASTLR